MNSTPKSPSPKKLKWIAALLFLGICAYTVFGFWGVPALVQSTLLPKLSESLRLTLAAEKVRANPYYLTLGLESLSISRKDGDQLASVADLALNISSRSLLTFKPVLQSVVLDTPDLNLVREKSGALNWPAPKPAPPKETPEKETAKKKKLRFWVDQVSIKNGRMAFNDDTVDFIHLIQDLNVAVEDLGFHKKKATRIDFSAHYNEAPVSINGAMRLFDSTPEAILKVQIESLTLPRFLNYLPSKPAATLTSGLLNTLLDIDFDAAKPAADQLLIKGTVSLEKMAIIDAQTEAMVTVPKAETEIFEAYPLGNRWGLEKVAVEAPYLRFKRSSDGGINLAQLALPSDIPAPSKRPSKGPAPNSATIAPESLTELLVKSILVTKGKVDLFDADWPLPFEKQLTDVAIQITDFTLNREERAKTHLTLNTQANESATLDGVLGLVPFYLDGDIALSNVQLADYLPFYHSAVGFDYADGRADAGGHIHFDTLKDEMNWALTNFILEFENILLTDRRSGHTVVNTKKLTAKECDLIPSKQILRIGKLTSPDGAIELVREASGNINLATLFSPQSEKTAPSKISPVITRPAEKKEDAASWQVRFETAELTNQTYIFKDETVHPAVVLKMGPSAVSTQNLVIGRPETGRFRFSSKIGARSHVKMDGSLRIDPFLLDSAVTARALDLTLLQPYFPKTVNLGLTSGRLYTNGQLMMALPRKEPFKLAVAGDVLVKDLATINTLNNQRLLDFENLSLKNATLTTQPFKFESDQLTLTDYEGLVTVTKEGQPNFRGLFGTHPKKAQTTPSTPSSSTPKTAKALPIHIKNISLQNGRITFSDQFVKPHFDARLDKINGQIIDVNPSAPARIKLNGLWEDLDPIEVDGTLNPFTQYPQTLLDLTVKGLNMSTFSPYSGKYLGHDVDRGHLSLKLNYKVDGSQLAGKNKAIIEDLNLGKPIDSPDAISIPIELAITLLKDLNDDIHLDVPVSGDLADPKFRLGRTILRIIGNLITKVIAAPFAMIGSLYGGGESLGYIDFDPGNSELLPLATEKLKTLAIALAKKSSLRLDIRGDADPDRDVKALQKQLFLEMIASVKKPAPETITVESVMALGDYEKRIKLLYKKMAPSTQNKSSTEPPTALQMEQALVDQITITDADLRQLANQRARTVHGFFLDQNQLDSDRFFILKPEIPPTKEGDPRPASQVRFTLR